MAKTRVAPLAVFDAQDHALGVDIGDLQSDGFGDAQTGAIAGHDDGAILDAGHGVEEGVYPLGTEDVVGF